MKALELLNERSKIIYIGNRAKEIYSDLRYESYESLVKSLLFKRYDMWFIENYIKNENDILEIIDTKPKIIIFGDTNLNELYKRKIIQYANFKNVPLLGPKSSGIYSDKFYFGRINPVFFKNKTRICVISSNQFIPYMIEKELSWYDWGISQCITIGSGDGLLSSYEGVLDSIVDINSCIGVIIHIDLNNYIESSIANYIKNNYHKPIIVFVTGRSEFPEKGYKLVKFFRDVDIDVALDIGEIVKMLKKII